VPKSVNRASTDGDRYQVPYYAIRVSGPNNEADGDTIKETFRGREADYTGSRNYVLVRHHLRSDELKARVEGMLSDGSTISLKRVPKKTYEWRSYQ
jgi:hypothetical protein